MTKKTEDLELVIFKAKLSGHARFVIENFLSELRYDNKKKFEMEKLIDWIKSSDEMFFYSDAFNYLMDENISDFSLAIKAGCTDVSEIAQYYMEMELSNEIVNKLL